MLGFLIENFKQHFRFKKRALFFFFFQIKGQATETQPSNAKTQDIKYKQKPVISSPQRQRGKVCQTNIENGRDLKEGYHKVLSAHPAAVLQHRGRQHSPRHMSHLVAHFELELLHKRVGLVVGTSHLQEKGGKRLMANKSVAAQLTASGKDKDFLQTTQCTTLINVV